MTINEKALDRTAKATVLPVFIVRNIVETYLNAIEPVGDDAVKEIISNVIHDNSMEDRCDVVAALIFDALRSRGIIGGK
jgi:hypothetical protein